MASLPRNDCHSPIEVSALPAVLNALPQPPRLYEVVQCLVPSAGLPLQETQVPICHGFKSRVMRPPTRNKSLKVPILSGAKIADGPPNSTPIGGAPTQY